MFHTNTHRYLTDLVVIIFGLTSFPFATSAQMLPTPREIIERYAMVHLKSPPVTHKTVRTNGQIVIEGINVPSYFEAIQRGQLIGIIRTTIQDGPETLQGFEGDLTWKIDGMGNTSRLVGSEANNVRRQFTSFQPFAPDTSNFALLETVGISTFDGHSTYEIRTARPGAVDVHWFYEVSTGLPLGLITRSSVGSQVTETRTVFADYKDFGSGLAPTRMTVSSGAFKMTRTILSVRYDDVDDHELSLPVSVRDLKPE